MADYFYPDKDDALTIELINGLGSSDYWEKSEKTALFVADEFLSVFSAVMPKLNILDLGCGKGRLLPFLAKYADNLYALEPDKNRCREAKEAASLVRTKSGRACKPKNGDISILRDLIGNNKLNAALSSHVLQHIKEDVAKDMYSRLSSFMKSGAILILSCTWNPGTEDRYTKEYFEDGKRISEPCSKSEFEASAGTDGLLPVAYYTKESVEKLLGDCGFKLELFWCYHYDDKDTVLSSEYDLEKNASGDFENARDVLYVFRKQ